MPKAIALFSGGLDSTLAILTILRQGIEVEAITFLTHFGCDISDRSSCSKNPFSSAEKFGFTVKLCHLADKFIEIVKNPKFGHGKNMNPCIDCRILMLKEAKELMNVIEADFIITGEVLGQRPMSQMRKTLSLIDREAAVEGLVLRPLSAKLLEPTIPEIKGIVDREKLHAFNGRSRKPQIALAKEFGLTDYPAPAGGCLLTEPTYAYRLKDLLTYNPNPDFKDLNLLKVGRHFRSSPSCKIIVGRDKAENEAIVSITGNSGCLLKVEGYGSPITLVTGEITDEALRVSASICARYSDAKNLSKVDVTVLEGDRSYSMEVSPANEDILERYRIEKRKVKDEKISIH
jgi:tRNA U34 2-thiouridine synthase MnmA/TrmU